MWKIGKIAAHATAKIVIASAKRLIDMRHCCLNSSRIAEISVPAWPMPIHQTKLMMSKAQPTGTLLPQMPMPVSTSLPRASCSPISSAKPIRKPKTQPSGVRLASGIWATASVTVSKSCPGAMTGSRTAVAVDCA